MKTRARKASAILAGFASLIVIAGFSMFLGWTSPSGGKPSLALLATLEVRRYVARTYPEQGYRVELGRHHLGIEGDVYVCEVRHPTSPDSDFHVVWKGILDDVGDWYDWRVGNRGNTQHRLERGFKEAVAAILGGAGFPYDPPMLYVHFQRGPDDVPLLVPDMELDVHNPPLPVKLSVDIETDDLPTYALLAEHMLELRTLMEAHGIPVALYSLDLHTSRKDVEGPESYLFIGDIPHEMIYDDGMLAERLEEHDKAWAERLGGDKEREMQDAQEKE